MSDENAAYPKSGGGKPRTLEVQAEAGERRFSPSTARNRDVVREAFFAHVARDARVLEVGSGTGEHGVHMVDGAPDLEWVFTEYNADALGGIAAWARHSGHGGLGGPFQMDASSEKWGEAIEGRAYDALFTANVIHISPFTVAAGIFAGGARLLPADGKLFIYGPFGRDGWMADGNRRFDVDLKRRDPAWGVRDLERGIVPLAAHNGFALSAVVDMPANNFSVVFVRA